jgi:hypothetical protein
MYMRGFFISSFRLRDYHHPMPLKLAHDEKAAVVALHYNDLLLFQYNYAPTFDLKWSRKPNLHPVNSLAGRTLTGHPPKDHAWHHGIQMTCAHLRTPDQEIGQNFWGGPTYVRGRNYVQLDNVGSQRHDAWDTLVIKDNAATLAHRLTWLTSKNQPWIAESRRIVLAELNEADGYYALDWHMVLKNVHTTQLLFGSPTTAGRPNAGYGGLFWRGHPDFKGKGGQILAGNNLAGPETMGHRAPWLAFIGTHRSLTPTPGDVADTPPASTQPAATDAHPARSTLLFIDRPGNPDYPNKWFVRTDPFPIASFPFSFDREIPLDPGQTLTLNHRILFADSAWTRDRIENYLVTAGLHD